MNDNYYPVHSPYRFGPFATRFNEYTQEAHRDLRQQAAMAGWIRIKLTVRSVAKLHSPEISNWFKENQVVPLNLSYYNELWFESEDDAALFKITWG